MKISEFLKKNDIKLSCNSKAYKLLQMENCDELELIQALQKTKAYETNKELQSIVYEVMLNNTKKHNEHIQNFDNFSDYDLDRDGEAR